MQNQNGLAAQAYQQMREAILEGEHPPGAVLFESHLAEKLGMSRTPIREALQVLARDGFVEIVPNRGYFVPRMSLADIRELYELRESLEGFATRCATLRATDSEIEELVHLFEKYERAQTWKASVQIGTEFHNKIISLACNKRLTTFLDSLKAQISMTRQTQLRDVKGRREESVLEHRAILDAIKQRDPDAAEKHARAHVRLSYEATIRGFHSGHQS
jgi:DNA-binding GntR family transcriptional regulator